MERDPAKTRQAEELEEDEMDTSGHGDVLKDAVDRVAPPSKEEREKQEGLKRLDDEDMDTRGHGDTKRVP